MTEIKIINQQEVLNKQFKVYGTIQEPLFLAKDVAEWIEYSGRTGQLLNTVDEDEKLTHTIYASGQNREMWFLTENGLYEVLMLSRKPIAKQFKKEVKKILKSIRQNGGYIANQENLTPEQILANASLVGNNVIENQKRQLEEQKPKVEYFNIVADSKDNIDIGSFAKILKDKNINLGRNRLFDWFRKHQIFMKNNTPYQTYIDRDYFKVIQTAKGDRIYLKTLITPKGTIYFTEKIVKEFKGEN